MLLYQNGETFALGSSRYPLHPTINGEQINRIFIPIIVGNLEARAYLDTGGIFLICHPTISTELKLNPREGIPYTINFRGNKIDGNLHSIDLEIPAEDGEGIKFKVTAFIPDENPNMDWSKFPFPILGYHGCLEFIRFAIDPRIQEEQPSVGRIYFGCTT